jgi:hypothetical protein
MAAISGRDPAVPDWVSSGAADFIMQVGAHL